MDERNKLKVLIVEDEPFLPILMGDMFRERGYEICGATGYGEEALEMIERFQPDLVLMDIKLKGKIDGIETARRIQELHGLPLIFVTAYSDPQTLNRARRLNPAGCLEKPFDENELLDLADSVFGASGHSEDDQGGGG